VNKTSIKYLVLFLFVIVLFVSYHQSLFSNKQDSIESYAKISSEMINESSGIIKSQKYDDVYWTHNDSGDEARIFAIRKDGSLIEPSNKAGSDSRSEKYNGITINGAKNVDWEDIAIDDKGNLFIGDFGNNANKRKDLSIYMIKEPDPTVNVTAEVIQQIKFHFPEQDEFPPTKNNFDVEAMFYAKDNIYILSKHRADLYTKLYRINLPSNNVDKLGLKLSIDPKSLGNAIEVAAEFIAEFYSGSGVTAADASFDMRNVVILTYTNVWYFDNHGMNENFFNSEKHYLNLSAKQCEAVCFSGGNIIITNEQKDMYSLDYKSLPIK